MLPQISKFFSSFSLLELAFNTKFIKNHSYKIDPDNFIMSFFEEMNEDYFSWEGWAKQFCILSDTVCSSNGLMAKFGFRYISFYKTLLENALVFTQLQSFNSPPIADKFKHIWITDSTCLSMPDSMDKIFPGSRNHIKSFAMARIQLTMDLITDQIFKLDISSFRNNDQSYSGDVLSYAESGDLVIRDLGYFVTDVFKKLNKKNVKFISKIRYGLNIYDEEETKLNLLKKLKNAFDSGSSHIDWPILLSNKKIPVRLLALKAESKTTDRRVRKAKKDRQPSTNHGPEYFELLGYHILITNIEKHEISLKDIWTLYQLRWRIEIVFKCWKSKLNLDKLFKHITTKNYSIPYCMLYMALTKIVICHNTLFVPLRMKISNKRGIPNLSMLKYYNFLANEFHLIKYKSDKVISQFIIQFVCYRHIAKRKTHFELLYMLNSS